MARNLLILWIALLSLYREGQAAAGDLIWYSEVITATVDSGNYGNPPTDAFTQDGVGITIDYAFPDYPMPWPHPYYNVYFRTLNATLGNEMGFLFLTMDSISGARGGNTECTRAIFRFSPAVSGLQFPLLDIDYNRWRDMVLVRATYRGALVQGTATIVDPNPTVQLGTPAGVTEYTCTDIQNEFGNGLCLTGIQANAGPTETRGNVEIHYAELVDRIEITYCESDNPFNDGQIAGIGDLSWTGNLADDNIAREYDDAPASYGSASHNLNDTPLLEWVTVPNVDERWQTVFLNNAYIDPVVVCTSNLYTTGNAPAVVRVRNAASTGFEVRLQNPGNGSAVTASTVRCLVAESGYHSLPDGRQFEAHKQKSSVTDNTGSWVGESATILGNYTTPVVLGQVMTFNDPNWSVFWSSECGSRNHPPTATSLCIGKHVGEDTNTTRADETLGYIVVEQGSGSFGNVRYIAALGGDTVQGVDNAPPYSYLLSTSSSSTYDFAVATQSAMDGGNGSWAVLYGTNPISGGRLDLAVDEDQIGDSERWHITEQVAYWAFHRIPSPYLGDRRGDRETGSQNATDAEGDDTAAVDDEDGVSFRSPAGTNHSIFADVVVQNPTAANVTLCGWLDVPSGGTVDGAFDAADGICQSVSPGTQTITLQWSNLPTDQAYTTYARFRVTSGALTTADATGTAPDGEVEDYQVQFDFRPTAVTIGAVRLRAVPLREFLNSLDQAQLARWLQSWAPSIGEGWDRASLVQALLPYLDPDGDGQLALLSWDTLEERGTLGFYVERRPVGTSRWIRINEEMLPGLIDAPAGGQYQLIDPGAERGSYEYRLIEQEARGAQRIYGPFEVRLP